MSARPPQDPGTELAEMVKACTLASIQRTSARSPAAAAWARHNLDDVTQAAALAVLEAAAAGDQTPPQIIASRAANAALMRGYRHEVKHAAPGTAGAADDDTTPGMILEPSTSGRAPEEAAQAAELIHRIAQAMPPAYRDDAPQFLAWTAAGYTAAEIARHTGQQPRRLQRLIQAARAAAEKMITE